jgi:energy-coupling factor transport system permease protein
MIGQTPAGRRGRLMGWGTRDLLVVAAIGVVLGIVLVPVIYASGLLVALGPLGPELLVWPSAVPALIAARVTRRPGAALLCNLFVGLVQVPLTPFGWVVLPLQLIPALGCEAAFLATRYRNFRLPVLIAGGIAAALLGLVIKYVPLGYQNLSVEVQLGIFVVLVAGGALAGLAAKLTSNALARTGVLSGYAVESGEEV